MTPAEALDELTALLADLAAEATGAIVLAGNRTAWEAAMRRLDQINALAATLRAALAPPASIRAAYEAGYDDGYGQPPQGEATALAYRAERAERWQAYAEIQREAEPTAEARTAGCPELDDPEPPEVRHGRERRGANWTPPANGEPCFVGVDADSEWCSSCSKHISRHYGGTEYRCDPRLEPPEPQRDRPDCWPLLSEAVDLARRGWRGRPGVEAERASRRLTEIEDRIEDAGRLVTPEDVERTERWVREARVALGQTGAALGQTGPARADVARAVIDLGADPRRLP